MIRQNPDSYDQKKDSPLIGGYGSRENINFATEPEVGWGPYVRTCDIITLLEQAAEEFPKVEDLYPQTGRAYKPDKVDRWKRKWLTVPPVSG